MPLHIKFEHGLIRIDFVGRVTNEQFQRGLREVEALEAGLAVTPDRLADLSAITESELRFKEIFAFVGQRQLRRFPNPFRTAIVAQRPADIGTARTFQLLLEHPQITVQIFPDVTAALAWLAEDRRVNRTAPAARNNSASKSPSTRDSGPPA